MTTADAREISTSETLAAFSRDLQKLRLDAGGVSFGEIARRIVERRTAEGASPAASRVARSTVFDVFQPGRRRMNATLVGEIVRALGLSDAEAAHWQRRCVAAQSAEPRDGGATPRPVPSAAGEAALPRTLRRIVVTVLLIGCVGVNLFGTTLVLRAQVPLFLDMIGTAAAAFALGPWYAAAVGAVTNLFGMVSSSPETIVFALVNVAGALVWGYGARRFARDIPRFVMLNIAVAVACTVVAVPLNVALYGEQSSNPSGTFVSLLAESGLLPAVLWVNLAASVLDKLIAGFVGLGIARLLAPLALTSAPPALVTQRTARRRIPA
jgi:energy-coupling factor transport system substrate-specific component